MQKKHSIGPNPIFGVLCLLISLLSVGCASLPGNSEQLRTYAPKSTDNTYLGQKFDSEVERHPGKSGFLLLSEGLEAFAARASLIKLAEKTIDVQYYFIRYDFAGSVFMGLLIEAANRGVRVRILLDDHYLADKDEKLLAISGHPNIEIRTFNPFRRGTPRYLQFVSNFGDISRRMHNKSFTVDNKATIIGGRNIGAEYFEADNDVEFGDLDVLSIGPLVQAVSNSFDSYWNNPLAYTHRTLLKLEPTDISVRKQTEELLATLSQESDYRQALEKSKLIESIQNDTLQFVWADSTLIADSPDKLRVSRSRSDLHLQKEFDDLFIAAENEVIIYSPYFIPGKVGSKDLASLVEKGIKVRIFTNSAASNNVAMVHAHYSKYRKRLLKSGVELFEVLQPADARSNAPKDGQTTSADEEKIKKIGSATIHAKSFVIDRKKVFIGSFNFDPRSAIENTEIGVVIDSDELGQQFGDWFDANIDRMAYRLKLQGNTINWEDNSGATTIVNPKEPDTGWWARSKLKILGWLPVGGLL